MIAEKPPLETHRAEASAGGCEEFKDESQQTSGSTEVLESRVVEPVIDQDPNPHRTLHVTDSLIRDSSADSEPTSSFTECWFLHVRLRVWLVWVLPPFTTIHLIHSICL